MQLRTQEPKTSHQRLAQVGRILINGIYRLEKKEREKNRDNQLDSNFYPSVHGTGNNLNQTTL